MKNNYQTIIFTFVILLYFSMHVEAQTEDLLQEASREIITKIDHEDFTLILERFEDDGVPNLSMSKGFEFLRIGGDLKTIFHTLWPKHNFYISPEVLRQHYHLMLQHLDQKRTDDFLEMVFKEFRINSGFDLQQREETQIQYCVEIDALVMLNENKFVPDKGVLRSTTYSGVELTLSGFTLEDIMAEISNKSGSIFSLNTLDLHDQTFELSFNLTNLNTIIESLERYGLSSRECEIEVEVIYIK